MENTCGGGGGEDVLIQILMWLPVKSLLRFKSVCKSWRALIRSSFFIDLHTTATSPSSKFGTFILQAIEYSEDLHSCDLYTWRAKIKMFMLSSGCGGGGATGEDEDDEDDQVVFSPFYTDFLLTHSISMVGSCNGLICLHDSNRRDVSLWNPATRQFRTLPKSITIEVQGVSKEQFLDDFVAFGFDVKTKDYKVVWITPFIPARDGPMEEGCMCRVQVYNLSTDCWRLLEGINYLPVLPTQGPFLNHGIYLNGSYFFVGRKIDTRWSFHEGDDGSNFIPRDLCNNSLMLSFDFTKEIFTTMQFPDHDVRHRMVFSYLGEKMVVFITRGDHDYAYEYCDIWVLNEHGSSVNKESWTKLHSFRIKNIRASALTRPEPICISNEGKFALISTTTYPGGWGINKLQLFNLVTQEAKRDFTIGDGVSRIDVYKQSLVSIIRGNQAAADSR